MPRRAALYEWPLGGLFLSGRPDASSLPLLETRVAARILGPLASVTVAQDFHNPFDRPLELEYLFPLPENSAIFDFEFQIGSECVKADVEANETARERYEQALNSGRRAALFEERRPNLFALLLANVQPTEKIAATLRYQQPLTFAGDAYEWVFPMGITPKYHQDAASAEETDSPLALPGEQIGKVRVHVVLDAGQAALDPASPSHPLKITRLDERRFEVEVTGEQIPDKDFVLRYNLAEKKVQCPVWVSENGDAATALLTLVPNSWAEQSAAAPREFVFVLDRSGSMAGSPLAQASNALSAGLRTLRPEDAFYLIAFDDKLELLSNKSASFNQANLDLADGWLGLISARGGTEIGLALKAALELPADGERQRHIIFFTDGAVSAEEQVLAEVRRGIGNARLFAFGIGPSVNRAFIKSLARLGRGTSEFLQLDEDIETAIIRFHDRLAYPLLQELRLKWEGATAWDVLPADLPDLYYGQPVQVCAKLRPQPDATVTISGKCGGDLWEKTLVLPAGSGHDELILRTWAQARIDALLDKMQIDPRKAVHYRDEIIGLAMENHLLTEYTSLVAVQEEAVSQVPAMRLKVAVPLPQGLREEGFLGNAALHYNASMVAFSRMGRMADSLKTRFHMACEQRNVVEPAPENIFARLARSQKADGSWSDGAEALEWSCAAVIAFVRHGHTLSKGIYRRVLEKAIFWLLQNSASDPLGRQMRALALWEMKQASDHPLLAGIGAEEEMLVKSIASATANIVRTAEELRLAAMVRKDVEVVFEPAMTEVSHVWLAVFKD